MRILSVGDLHGIPIVDELPSLINDYDKIVCVGDYVDSFSEKTKDMKTNLMRLILFANDHPDKMVLLLGNHDIQYYFFHTKGLFRQLKCSGYRANYAWILNQIFQENKRLFKVAYQVDNFLFTHAGISNKYYNRFLVPMFEYLPDHLVLNTLAEKLEFCFFAYNRFNALFNIGNDRGGDKDSLGGIFWADMSETQGDYLEGYHQIVGHTHTDVFRLIEHPMGSSSIAYIDVLPKAEHDDRLLNNKYYVVDTENYYVTRQ